jgi:hypothetical protein
MRGTTLRRTFLVPYLFPSVLDSNSAITRKICLDINDNMIALERARVESEKAAAQKAASPESNGSTVTTTKAQREGNRPDVLNVLIASPSDVNDERDAVTTAIHDWNAVNAHPDTINILLYPIRWEAHSYPESGDRPQALLNRQIVARGDFLIGIFGARLGTPTGVAESGTIEEIEQFRKAGKYVALYFSNALHPAKHESRAA